jgi:hypothetical protein
LYNFLTKSNFLEQKLVQIQKVGVEVKLGGQKLIKFELELKLVLNFVKVEVGVKVEKPKKANFSLFSNRVGVTFSNTNKKN